MDRMGCVRFGAVWALGAWFCLSLAVRVAGAEPPKLESVPEGFTIVDFGPHVNMGWRDEVAGDGKGGWTDQGSNDMRNAPVGLRRLRGVPFRLIDPKTNDGKAVLVLKSKNFKPGPEKVSVPLRGATADRVLFSYWQKPIRRGEPPFGWDPHKNAFLRGKAVFELARCATCHSGPMKTDRRSYPMPHATRMDKGRPFDTPTLVEIWRTAPYLYDGRAATMSDALRVHTDRSKALSREDFEALVEYLLSL